MLIKPFYLFLILCVNFFLCTVSKDAFNINFLVNDRCTQPKGGTTHIIAKEGQTVHITAEGKSYINYYDCSARGVVIASNLEEEVNENATGQVDIPKIKLTKNMEGLWICNFYTNKDNTQLQLPQYHLVKHKNSSYIVRDCHLNVTVKAPKTNSTGLIPVVTDSKSWIYITAGTLLLFTLIILIQAWVIIRCKVKARRATRIQSLKLRERNSVNKEDTQRYSAPPTPRKSRISKMFEKYNQKDEACIYETLEEAHGGQPPTPPIETIPTLRKKPNKFKSNNSRPPVPLPKDVSDDDVTDSVRDTKRPVIKQTPQFLRKESSTSSESETKSFGTLKSLKKQQESPPTSDAEIKSIGNLKPLKKQLGPAIVASELDQIFKQRQTASQPMRPPAPTKSPAAPISNISQRQQNQKFGKSDSFPSKVNPLKNFGTAKRSLPDVKPQRMLDTERESIEPQVPPQKVNVPNVIRSAPKAPPNPVQTPLNGSLKKKPLPPVPVPAEPPPQGPSRQLPHHLQQHAQGIPVQAPYLNQVQEPLYEEYDEEEPVYNNSDDEWTYEPLPRYNIYSQ